MLGRNVPINACKFDILVKKPCGQRWAASLVCLQGYMLTSDPPAHHISTRSRIKSSTVYREYPYQPYENGSVMTYTEIKKAKR